MWKVIISVTPVEIKSRLTYQFWWKACGDLMKVETLTKHILNYFSYVISALKVEWVRNEYIWGVTWPPTLEDIPEPNHSRTFCKKFHSVYMVKGVWILLTHLLLNRHKVHLVHIPLDGASTNLMSGTSYRFSPSQSAGHHSSWNAGYSGQKQDVIKKLSMRD